MRYKTDSLKDDTLKELNDCSDWSRNKFSALTASLKDLPACAVESSCIYCCKGEADNQHNGWDSPLENHAEALSAPSYGAVDQNAD
jgi:hypothetical protein